MKKIIIAIVVLILISTSVFFFFKIPEPECRSTEAGWYCSFGYSENSSKRKKIKENIEEYKQKCSEDGGKWNTDCRGRCGYFTTRYCDIAFDDEGEECSNSEECKGGCTIDREFIINNYPEIELNPSGYSGDITCKDECTGTCSKYILRKCDWRFEVDNGTIIDHTGIFC